MYMHILWFMICVSFQCNRYSLYNSNTLRNLHLFYMKCMCAHVCTDIRTIATGTINWFSLIYVSLCVFVVCTCDLPILGNSTHRHI